MAFAQGRAVRRAREAFLGWPTTRPGRGGPMVTWAGRTKLGRCRIPWRKAAVRERRMREEREKKKRKERKRKRERKGWFGFIWI